MRQQTPTPIPYQGSKRQLAPQILSWLPETIQGTYYEPFAGSAAVALAVANAGRAKRIVLSDILEPLIGIWRLILEEPARVANAYEKLWLSQLDDPRGTYDMIREEFNETGDPSRLLYLIARCVKNSVRFNPQGKFNQSPDNRRRGMRPRKMHRQVRHAHHLLAGKTRVVAEDYRIVISQADSNDLIYMDPPYQGVSEGKNPRYVQGLELETFVAELSRLNEKDVPYAISFDGQCGDRSYGEELPSELGLERILLAAGRSSQATLLGRSEVTVESLYISPALLRRVGRVRHAKGVAKQPRLSI